MIRFSEVVVFPIATSPYGTKSQVLLLGLHRDDYAVSLLCNHVNTSSGEPQIKRAK